MTNKRIGFIGVGLMGHGMAKNIVEKGFPLTVLGHRNRQPVDDLVKRGAKEAKELLSRIASLVGSTGAIQGASAAASRTMPKRPRPKTNERWWSRRFSVVHAGC